MKDLLAAHELLMSGLVDGTGRYRSGGVGIFRGEQQEDYYRVLAVADQQADATPFIEFMLSVLRDALREAVVTDQVSDHVADQVASLIQATGASRNRSQE